jgi:hypothetical protein
VGDPKDRYAVMLARQVLGQHDYENPRPHSGTGDPRLADAQMRVDLHLESMVRGICRQVWIDSAAVAANVESQVREAAAKADVETEIAKAVAAEFARMRCEITNIVKRKVEGLIDLAVSDAVGDAPRKLANKIAGRMWDAVFGNEVRRKGWPSTYAQGKRKR